MITRINAALAALLVLALILLAVVLIGGSRVLPWTTDAEKRVDAYADVQAAATRSVLAFLDVDYHHMEQKQQAVEDLSTGSFKEQYAGTAVTLKAAAEQAKAVSKGDVRWVGLRSVKGDTATAMVAANVVVSNASTTKQKATDACPHAGAACDKYRFVVTLTRTGDGWKMSDLAGVS
ncbi:hypothetical protein [Nocardioides nematodiphilus]|uniref:hypothetical protein n=1 Tax=Nocardioides nematodiphilus TaxID=2849669 RepID=UPI001CD993AA|nr:hypothetical protein [Nocardioides nematodiphilus]MCA1982146.1 hypothetical protein [Nocardioides nematodiphilus]